MLLHAGKWINTLKIETTNNFSLTDGCIVHDMQAAFHAIHPCVYTLQIEKKNLRSKLDIWYHGYILIEIAFSEKLNLSRRVDITLHTNCGVFYYIFELWRCSFTHWNQSSNGCFYHGSCSEISALIHFIKRDYITVTEKWLWSWYGACMSYVILMPWHRNCPLDILLLLLLWWKVVKEIVECVTQTKTKTVNNNIVKSNLSEPK